MEYCKSLASVMKKFSQDEDVPHILRHCYIADTFDKARVQEMSGLMTDPKNTLMFLTSKKLDDSTLPLKEKWYSI